MQNAISKGMDKMKSSAKKATSKLPKPMQEKADKKLGLFIHKYVATLYYFDEEIQEIYYEMEDAVEDGNMQKASELSTEMKTLIALKNNKDSGYHSRKHEKMTSKIAKKVEAQAERMEKLADSPRKLKDIASEVLGKDDISPEDVKEEFNIEDLEEEN